MFHVGNRRDFRGRAEVMVHSHGLNLALNEGAVRPHTDSVLFCATKLALHSHK